MCPHQLKRDLIVPLLLNKLLAPIQHQQPGINGFQIPSRIDLQNNLLTDDRNQLTAPFNVPYILVLIGDLR